MTPLHTVKWRCGRANLPESILNESAAVLSDKSPILFPGVVSQTRPQTATSFIGGHTDRRDSYRMERERGKQGEREEREREKGRELMVCNVTRCWRTYWCMPGFMFLCLISFTMACTVNHTSSFSSITCEAHGSQTRRCADQPAANLSGTVRP